MPVSEKSKKNLKKGKATQFKSGEKAVKAGRKGGKKSGEAKREMKIIKDEIVKRMKAKDWDEIIDGAIARAKNSDKGFETLRDTLGQKPIEEIGINFEKPEPIVIEGYEPSEHK